MKYKSVIFFIIYFILSQGYSQTVTTETLLDDLINLDRLAEISNPSYKVLHFSSYDRRSKGKSPDQEGWFLNSDGFGKETIPNFEQIIEEPGEDGIGRYLICDVNGPGAIVRTWSASIKGDIALYLDNEFEPFYQGPAEPFFVRTYDAIASKEKNNYENTFTQFVSGYFPIPFSKRCRIEWIGNVNMPHFYYTQIRQYDKGTTVQTFSVSDIGKYSGKIDEIKKVLSNPEQSIIDNDESRGYLQSIIKKGETVKIFELNGAYSIQQIKFKVTAGDLVKALRQNILRISFDNHHWGQVQSPIGDFFCTAPGINPSNSLPFTVTKDGFMTCRFYMPFKESCKIYIENYSNQDCTIEGEVNFNEYCWEDNRSMYFHAKWRTDNNITATNNPPKDLIFLMAKGTGRYVGTSVFLLNPATAPSRHGSWWGEGDEKVFIDNISFPTVFGTGSEDYFGYSWGAECLFNYAYIGQPRNDGPGNRGFVINYRYHIVDDFPFYENLDFFMELFHQDSVPGFSYGRIAYYYALPGSFDDHQVISKEDVRMLELPEIFHLKAFKGSRNYSFYEAESIVKNNRNTSIMQGPLWSENSLLVWEPENVGEKLRLSVPIKKKGEKMRVMLTVRGSPEDGKVSVFLNNKRNGDTINLNEDFQVLSKNIQLEDAVINEDNDLVLVFEGNPGQQVGIDFIWVRTE